MSNRIVLVSDDSDFFEYIRLKLELRKSDELLLYSFDDVPDNLNSIEGSVLIINSENSEDKVLALLKIFKGTPSIVMSYNENEAFKKKCYRAGMFDFMTILTPDSEFRARILPAMSVSSLLEKNKQYRDILVKNKILTENNEVFVKFDNLIDNELDAIKKSKRQAVFAAISPSDKSKFLIKPNTIETIILNGIRKNDILMCYAPNKYFLFIYDSDLKSAQKLWDKIRAQLSQKMYAGFVSVTNQSRQQLLNDVLNKLHEAINFDTDVVKTKSTNNTVLDDIRRNSSPYTNFKLYRQEFGKKIEQIISPVFYQVQQRYSSKLTGMSIEQNSGEGYGAFFVKGKHLSGSFNITSPGFSKINIDISVQKQAGEADTKRITLEPEELEQGLLEDLLVQFISEAQNG